MAHTVVRHQIGDGFIAYNYRICDKCGHSHNEHSYITEEGKELCAKCELERLGKFPKNKIYIIDGDSDRILAVFHKTKGSYFEDAVKSIVENKKVWWAMNNVTGKFNADVYIISNDLQTK